MYQRSLNPLKHSFFLLGPRGTAKTTWLKIHFKKGAPQDVKIKKKIPAGGETRVIDINGKNRIITKVTFWYTTSKPAPRGKAIVNLFGRK